MRPPIVMPTPGTPRRSRLLATAIAAAVVALVSTVVPLSLGASMATGETPTTTQPIVELGAAGSLSALASAALTATGGSAAGATQTSGTDPTNQAQTDLASAYAAVAALAPTETIAGDIGGRTFTPGIYHSDAALTMTSSVTFDALGDPNAVFIFQVGAAVNTTAGTTMILTNGAQASRIYWQTAAAVTTGAASGFVGTILGNAAITAGAGTVLQGRALTMDGAVTLDGTTLLPVPDIAITSSVAPSIDVEAGDEVVFTKVIRNRGNVDLTLSLGTRVPTDSLTTFAWPGATEILPAGQSVTVTTTYFPTLADAATRAVTSTATVIGTPADFAPVSASTSVTLVVHPTPVIDSIATAQGTPVTVNVLANDAGAEIGGTFSRATLGTKRRLIGGATGPVPSAPVNGNVTCVDSGVNRGLCTYQPAGNFVGTDAFDYTLSQDTRSWNVRVSVTVTATSVIPTASDIRIVATEGGPSVTFDPTANSITPDAGTLSLVSNNNVAAGRGSLVCLSTSCVFTPPASGFTGTATATFTLVETRADGVRGMASAPATMTFFIDPPALSPSDFVASVAATAPMALGIWTSSTTITDVTTTCSAGHPETSLAWNSSTGTTSWTLERRQGGTSLGPWIPIAKLSAATTTFIDTRLGEGNHYQWQVRPDNHRWQGVFSPPTLLTTEPPAVSAAGC